MKQISEDECAVVGQGLFESSNACRLNTVARVSEGAAVRQQHRHHDAYGCDVSPTTPPALTQPRLYPTKHAGSDSHPVRIGSEARFQGFVELFAPGG